MKIAIVHDWITNLGGAEKVLLKLHEIFPDAPIYTLVYDKKNMEKYFKGIEIRTSFIQKIPFGVKKYRYFLPLMPLAIEQFNLKEYDIVISSSSCCAKGINISTETTHICYCHTPMRYAWDMYWEYNQGNIIKKYIIAKMMQKLRIWDYITSSRVDMYIANSQNVAKRIKKHYNREAEVIYPAIDNIYYAKNDKQNKKTEYYLLVTRFVKYKKVNIIIEAFNELNIPLLVVGKGPEKNKIKKIAKKNITFKQDLKIEELKKCYEECKAFVFMAEEDFGMVMAEAEACGKPIIAYYKGGASEIVEENKTGILVKEQTKEALKKAIIEMESKYEKFDANEIRKKAQIFNEENFKKRMKEIIKGISK